MAGPYDKLPTADDRATILCLYCHRPQEVSRRAVSITCKFCNKRLQLDDITVATYKAQRSIDTVGKVDVQKKGNIVADRILCGGMVVRGKVKASILSHDTVVFGPEADVLGDVTAPALVVAPGAVLTGNYRIGPTNGNGQNGSSAASNGDRRALPRGLPPDDS